MNKALKTILIISVAVFSPCFILVSSTNAQVDELIVEYCTETERKPLKEPIFSETNFLPGDSVTRRVQVTNNSDQLQRIATKAINVRDLNNLGTVLNLEIKEGQKILYNNPLSRFFNTGEVFLSNLAGNGGSTQYDFTVSFYSGAQNPFQGRTLSFDILIGFQGGERVLLPGAGRGVVGFLPLLPPGLTISDESVRVTTITETNVTIIWTTNYLSTSQVIYSAENEARTLNLLDNTGTPPKYGYAHTTPKYDTDPRVTFHTVTITGLTPNTKYYYRTVSHASLAISREYSFTTLGVKEIGEIKKEIPSEEIPYEEEILVEEVVLAPTREEEIEKPFGEIIEGEEETVSPEEVEKPILVEERPLRRVFVTERLLAAIGAIPFNIKVILIIAGLVIAGLIVLRLTKKKKAKS